eukprot:CAMPEP_0180712966 /NCGR_PEP_ID=MMETSP1038_2-20121128/11643_1 /TAXON_ID=632150 /ORGANISM="Azadinium spinosum, Strain 3D9" /LENGTH=595 /DNA_ID=CAMNT_0022745245 /DNA_START=12 /DNA_END=1796 /DNA_ORIENTATION=-
MSVPSRRAPQALTGDPPPQSLGAPPPATGGSSCVSRSSSRSVRETSPAPKPPPPLSLSVGSSLSCSPPVAAPGVLAAQEQTATRQDLEALLECERSFWTSSMQDIHAQQMEALEVLTERVDLKVRKAMEAISFASAASEERILDLDRRVEARFGDLQLRLDSDRKALQELQREAEGQVQNLSSLSGSRRDAAEEGERAELLVALAAICKDVQALQEREPMTRGAVEALVQGQHMKDLDEIRAQLVGDVTVLRGELRSHGGDIESLQREQASALDMLRGQQISIESVGEKAQVLQAQCGQHCNALEMLQGSIRWLQSQHDDVHEALQSEAEAFSLMRNDQSKRGSELEAFKDSHRNELEDLRSQYGSFVERVCDQFKSETEAVRGQLMNEIVSLRSQSGNSNTEVIRLEQSRAIDALQSQHSRIEVMHTHLMSDVGSLKTQLVENVKAMRSQHSTAIEALHRQHSTRLEGLEAQLLRELEALRVWQRAQAGENEAFRKGQSLLMEELRSEQSRCSGDAGVQAHKNTLEALQSQQKRELEAGVESLRQVRETTLDALQSELETMRCQQRTQIEMLRRECSSHCSEFEELKVQLCSLR